MNGSLRLLGPNDTEMSCTVSTNFSPSLEGLSLYGHDVELDPKGGFESVDFDTSLSSLVPFPGATLNIVPPSRAEGAALNTDNFSDRSAVAVYESSVFSSLSSDYSFNGAGGTLGLGFAIGTFCATVVDIEVDKNLVTASPFIQGDNLVYTITVINNGPNTASNIQVSDTPTNLNITSVSSTNCNAFPCTIPLLTNGESEIITVNATIINTGVFDNQVSVVADEFDSDTSNNNDNTGNGGIADPSADVSVVKTLNSVQPFTAGETISYTLTVSNDGPDTANNTIVNDTPSNLVIETVSSSSCNAFPCTIPSLGNGAFEVIDVTARIVVGGAFDNIASVSADEIDPDTSNNTDDDGNGGTSGAAADVTVTKNLDTSGPFNVSQSVQYTITVTNNGPDTANNVLVVDTPRNLSITNVSSTNCNAFPCTIPSLLNGASETITVTATIDTSGAFDNVVTVSADEFDPDTSNNTDDDGNGGSTGPVADISLLKTLITSGPFSLDQSVDFEVVVTNNGPDTANNVVVIDTPTNLTIINVTSTNCNASPCTIPSLLNGASETITVTATIDNVGQFLNVASAAADEFDPDTNNNDDDGSDGNNGDQILGSVQSVPTLSFWSLLILIAMFLLMYGLKTRGVLKLV